MPSSVLMASSCEIKMLGLLPLAEPLMRRSAPGRLVGREELEIFTAGMQVASGKISERELDHVFDDIMKKQSVIGHDKTCVVVWRSL